MPQINDGCIPANDGSAFHDLIPNLLGMLCSCLIMGFKNFFLSHDLDYLDLYLL